MAGQLAVGVGGGGHVAADIRHLIRYGDGDAVGHGHGLQGRNGCGVCQRFIVQGEHGSLGRGLHGQSAAGHKVGNAAVQLVQLTVGQGHELVIAPGQLRVVDGGQLRAGQLHERPVRGGDSIGVLAVLRGEGILIIGRGVVLVGRGKAGVGMYVLRQLADQPLGLHGGDGLQTLGRVLMGRQVPDGIVRRGDGVILGGDGVLRPGGRLLFRILDSRIAADGLDGRVRVLRLCRLLGLCGGSGGLRQGADQLPAAVKAEGVVGVAVDGFLLAAGQDTVGVIAGVGVAMGRQGLLTHVLDVFRDAGGLVAAAGMGVLLVTAGGVRRGLQRDGGEDQRVGGDEHHQTNGHGEYLVPSPPLLVGVIHLFSL